MDLKRVGIGLGIGLVVFWVIGIILANFFNVDMDKELALFWNNFFGLVILLGLMGLVFMGVVGLRTFRAPNPPPTDDPRRQVKIAVYFLVGVTLPIFLSILFIFLGSAFRLNSVLDSGRDSLLVMGIGTILAASGLPFIIKMLLLIKSELKAVGAALLLVPYGLGLWLAILFLMLLMFTHASCC